MKSIKKENLMPSVILGAICLIVALLLSVVNMFTAPEIAKRNEQEQNKALIEVLPNGSNFKEITLTDEYPEVVTKGYSADGGHVFVMQVVGYSAGLEIICGITTDGKVAGVKHLQSNETYGLEPELNEAYVDDTLDTVELIIATGASPKSKTSQAYYTAIKAALQAAAIAGGASVDTRTPEQILQDNCNTALGTNAIQFTKWFATEIITGVDAVYEATDGSGRVYSIGERFIGIKADGTVATADAAEADKSAALAADSIISASSLTKITNLPDGLHQRFVEAYVTASGNYVITAKGQGYASGEYIVVKISISAEGKIIETATISHAETDNVGGEALADQAFIGQFVGKTEENYSSVDGPSGATVTSDGYKSAIRVAFDAFELFTGGNQ